MNVRTLCIAFSWCVVAIPSVTLANDTVYQWLERMDAAMSQMNYQGTFVYVHDDDVESMRITHVVDDRGLHERLVSVSGTPREVIRDAKGVRWLSGENHTMLANAAASRTFFPKLPLGDPHQASQSYEFRLANNQRIAGHSTQRLDILPKDQYRYGYSLWLELQSSLLLQWELTGEKGETLAKLMFTDLNMGSEVDPSELRSTTANESAVPVTSQPIAESPSISGPLRWKPARLPAGFRLTSNRQQKPQQGSPFEHLVYSDGIAAVSVYIESAEPDSDLKLGLSTLGTTHVFTRKLDNELITVLGDVPAVTVKLIGNSFEASRP